MRGHSFASLRVLTAFAVIAMMMAVSLSVFADGSDAADPGVSDPVIQIFDAESDLTGLAYLSEELPDSLNASEWVRDSDGFWYNINSLSANCGKILTYSMVADITDAEMESDILLRYPVFTTDFLLIQISFKLNYGCSVTVDIDKDGTGVYHGQEDMVCSVSNYVMHDGMDRAVVLTVKDAGADINVASVRGTYTASLSYNGIAAGEVSEDYLGSMLQISGKVIDADGVAIPGAAVNFSDGSVVTDSHGIYTKYVEYGSVVNVTSITAAGYTLEPYSFGTVTADIADADFSASERTVVVHVEDASGRAASGVQVRAYWYSSTGTGPYDIEVTDEGLTVVGNSKADGTVRVTLAQVKPGAKLYIYGNDNTTYRFTTDPMPSGTGSLQPIPETLVEPGNRYANTATLADVTIYANESSVAVTVAGAKDTSLAGGAPLPYVYVNAVWYYQVEDSGNYTISLEEDIEAGTFLDLQPGLAKLSNSYTDDAGSLYVIYRKPVWTAAPGETAHLYVHVSGTDPLSGSSEFAFTTAVIADGDKSIEELTLSTGASKAMEMSAIADLDLVSDDVAYTLTGTVTGTVPDELTAIRLITETKSDMKIVSPVAGTITFTFPLKAGVSSTVRIAADSEYEFSNPVQTLPSALGDQAFSSTSAFNPPQIARSAVELIETYTVTGSSAGDTVTTSYVVADRLVTATAEDEGGNIPIKVYGRAGNVVDSISIAGNGSLYVGEIQDNTAPGYAVTERKVVTYNDPNTNIPSMDTVEPNTTVQVFCDGKMFATVNTDSDGIATVSLPDPAHLAFKVGDYTAYSDVTSEGPYTGFVAVNLTGLVDPPVPANITLTIRYIATSGMQNVETPTNVDILDSPLTVTYGVGTTQTLNAPDLDGFSFSGWFINGTMVSNPKNLNLCTLAVTADMDGAILLASYAAESPEPPKESLGTPIAIGVLSITLSIIALIFVLLQRSRY